MENLKTIVKNHLSGGTFLMDLVHNPNSDFIKITIDSPKNITITETSNIVKRIRNDDNILSMFPNGFHLEVTTPGVGSNLLKKFQYEKNIGRKIFIEYLCDDFNITSDVFVLIGVEEKGIMVSKNEKNHLIMFENIKLAKIKVSFD